MDNDFNGNFDVNLNDGEERHSKKKRDFKVLKTIFLALLFGVISGICMFGVNYLGDKYIPQGNSSTAGNPKTIKSVSFETASSVSSTNQSEGVTVTDVSKLVEVCEKSVVAISGSITTSYYYQKYESDVAGSGIIIGLNDDETELLIVTNAHVVDDVNDLKVTFADGEEATAVLKGSKTSKDLAVIAVYTKDITQDTMDCIAIAQIGDASEVKEGQAAIAIGNALGYGQSVTVGVVSALGRSITIESSVYENLIQTDAAINPGNSGGALFNASGEVIGINSAKLSDESVEGIGYAIPISEVMDIIENLGSKVVRDEEVDENSRGYIGITGKDVTSNYSNIYGYPQGVYISKVEKDSPADMAGLKSGDIIVSFDDNDAKSMSTLKKLLSYYSIGETVEIEYYRLVDDEYELKSTTLTLRKNEA